MRREGPVPTTIQPGPTQGDQLYEGKAKRVYATDDPGLVIFEYKDDATAFNGQKHEQFGGKGELNNRLSGLLLSAVERAGVPTHFVRLLDDRRQLCRRVAIVPLEVVVRNRAAGSMAKRLGLEEGMALRTTVIEWCLKDDALGDPLVGADHAVAIGAATWSELGFMERVARLVNTILTAHFARVGIELIDFKLEFGRSDDGSLVLADEISPDTCRLWDAASGERLDKDRFRRDLAPLLDGYREVLRRLEGVADAAVPGDDVHDPADRLHEECGIFGIYLPPGEEHAHQALGRLTYYGLYALQHRGQESAGIVAQRDGALYQHRGMGLVADVFSDAVLDGLSGRAAIGHTRYSTAGSSTLANAQPLMAQSRLGEIAIGHNGNLVNAPVIRDLLEDAGVMFQTSSDSEVILNLIARGARYGLRKALVDAMRAIQGAFSLVVLTEDSLIAVRDPKGIRPLVMGKLGEATVVASESCALDAVGAEYLREVHPGEIVIIGPDGVESLQQHEKTENRVCSFEFVYFSRPDSIVDDVNVYASRIHAGRILAREAPVEADLVSGVPDSGVVAAHGYAEATGLPLAMTLIKNKYVGRSFIAPTQELRERAVGVKLNVLRANVEGKRIVLIDDSIVRGTTMRRLVTMLRRAGAAEVHVRIASPPVKYPCYFGMDYPSREELAGSRPVEAVREMIGADSLAHLSVEGLDESLGSTGHFCMACLTGVYPVPAPLGQEKDHLPPPAIAERERLAGRGAAVRAGERGEARHATADPAPTAPPAPARRDPASEAVDWDALVASERTDR